MSVGLTFNGVLLTGDENCSTCWAPFDEEKTFFHCNRCPGYHLCAACFVTAKHQHKMNKTGPQFLTTDDTEDTEIIDESEGMVGKKVIVQTQPMSESVENCLLLLNHTQHCSKDKCRSPACLRMRRVIEHSQQCRRKEGQTEPCPVCKQLVALITFHSRSCDYERCSIPYCTRIKEKLAQNRSLQQTVVI
ncbi:uncharacterized protein B4U80_03585 [Leptotrombidium deliense]|uniref:histone acetyltransferase n=1 Tax=Leptotrombidium deliense TaxID=299467 RepID=A0A443S5Y7_9ACAR|nr:uncharacterized protein B4U80_03585 [Leptotrombidium deliense]